MMKRVKFFLGAWKRNFFRAERQSGFGLAFRMAWLALFVWTWARGYQCAYCKVGYVRKVPTTCPMCMKHLSVPIKHDSPLASIVEAGLRNDVIWEFRVQPIDEEQYAVTE